MNARIDYQFNYLPLLECFASDREISWLMEENSISRFYQLWTTKEAILKCSDVGMTDSKFSELIIQRNDLLYYGQKIINLQYNYEYYISACIAGEDD